MKKAETVYFQFNVHEAVCLSLSLSLFSFHWVDGCGVGGYMHGGIFMFHIHIHVTGKGFCL